MFNENARCDLCGGRFKRHHLQHIYCGERCSRLGSTRSMIRHYLDLQERHRADGMPSHHADDIALALDHIEQCIKLFVSTLVSR